RSSSTSGHHASVATPILLDVPAPQADNGPAKFTGGVAMTNRGAVLLVAVAVLLPARSLVAHHSFAAEFDANKPVKVTGAVTKFEWTNPHAWIYIDTKDEKTGEVANWGFELAAASGLMRSGWTRLTLKAGDVVTIEGTRA